MIFPFYSDFVKHTQKTIPTIRDFVQGGIKMLFIERLNALIKEKGINRLSLTQELHIGKNQIKYWEDNNTIPEGATLVKIADYFGVSVDYLLGKTDKKNKTVTDERSLTDTERELLAVTADMDEDEKNALLGYAARLIAKRKKED